MNRDAVDQGAKTGDERSAVVLSSRMIRQRRRQYVYRLYAPV
jgi:hypothetical protein